MDVEVLGLLALHVDKVVPVVMLVEKVCVVGTLRTYVLRLPELIGTAPAAREREGGRAGMRLRERGARIFGPSCAAAVGCRSVAA